MYMHYEKGLSFCVQVKFIFDQRVFNQLWTIHEPFKSLPIITLLKIHGQNVQDVSNIKLQLHLSYSGGNLSVEGKDKQHNLCSNHLYLDLHLDLESVLHHNTFTYLIGYTEKKRAKMPFLVELFGAPYFSQNYSSKRAILTSCFFQHNYNLRLLPVSVKKPLH